MGFLSKLFGRKPKAQPQVCPKRQDQQTSPAIEARGPAYQPVGADSTNAALLAMGAAGSAVSSYAAYSSGSSSSSDGGGASSSSDGGSCFCSQRPLPTDKTTILLEACRAAGGIVHRDGNIFFKSAEQFFEAALAALHTKPAPPIAYAIEAMVDGSWFIQWPVYDTHAAAVAAMQTCAKGTHMRVTPLTRAAENLPPGLTAVPVEPTDAMVKLAMGETK